MTTTISVEKGILQQLPAECPSVRICKADIAERNLFRININTENEIMLKNEIIPIEKLKQTVIHQSLNQIVMRALSKIVNTSNSLDDDLETIKL